MSVYVRLQALGGYLKSEQLMAMPDDFPRVRIAVPVLEACRLFPLHPDDVQKLPKIKQVVFAFADKVETLKDGSLVYIYELVL